MIASYYLMKFIRTTVTTLLFAIGHVFAAESHPLPNTVFPGAQLVEVYSDGRFFEGPSWDQKGHRLYFTAFDKDNQQILRLDAPGKVTVWADKTEGINGTYYSLKGRLLGAQAYGHRVTDYAFGENGPADPKVLLYDPSLNQPNDICQAPNGNLYFTDPDFKKRQTSAVFLYTTGRKLTRIITDMPLPNGLKVSNDGRTLYVGDSYLKHWKAYPVLNDGTVGPGKVFFDPKTENMADPDGFTIDARGNLYFSGRGGVWVVNKSGQELGFIPVPEFVSNLTFGGLDGQSLYLTCKGKVYSLMMNVRGAQFK